MKTHDKITCYNIILKSGAKMVWNFDYTIPSIIGLSFFVIYYFLKPNVLVQSNRYYFTLIIVEIFGFFSDIIASYTDGYAPLYNRNFLIFLNGFYFLLFIARHYIVSMFFASLLGIHKRKDIPTIIVSFITIAITITILINPFTEFLYQITPEGRYIRKSNYILVYYATFATLLLDLYYVIKNRKKLETPGLLSALFSILALFSGSLMKIFFMKYLLIDMFFLFVIVALFLAFENPEIYIERKTGLYNLKAFNDVLAEYFFRNKRPAIITVCIKNYIEKREIYGSTQMDSALKEIGKFFLHAFPDKNAFYLRNGRISMIESSTKDFHKIKEIVSNKFLNPWNIKNSQMHLRIAIVDMSDKLKMGSIEDIHSCFRTAYMDALNAPDNHISINQNAFRQITHSSMVSKALDRALSEDDLQLYLQPIIDSQTRKIIAAEALVRIYDAELGLVTPIEFISMAEKNGNIEQLGLQILNKVCQFLKDSQIYNNGVKWINVNLSPIQCQNNSLPELIDTITDKNTIDHSLIHLEITEDSMIDPQILQRQMNILITDGYNFSLDDFGTGFSNVTRLNQFPFDNIKLDMSVVREHFTQPDNVLPSIVKAFVSRGLSVTAEGVETKEMADGLTSMGVKYLQGYYFSKPIPTHEFEKLVKDN